MQGRKAPNTDSIAPTATDGGQTASPASPALSQLARDLHDLNQPLSAINNYAQAGLQLIDNGRGDIARLKDLFSKIVAQSARGTALSQQMSKTLARESQ